MPHVTGVIRNQPTCTSSILPRHASAFAIPLSVAAAAELVPLRRHDVAEAATLSGIANADAFLARIDELQIASFAIKPVTLGMLISTYLREGDLPNSVLELYEKGCGILCEEQNESRRAAGR